MKNIFYFLMLLFLISSCNKVSLNYNTYDLDLIYELEMELSGYLNETDDDVSHLINNADFTILARKFTNARIDAMEAIGEDFYRKYAEFKGKNIKALDSVDKNDMKVISRGTPCYDSWSTNQVLLDAGFTTCIAGAAASSGAGGVGLGIAVVCSAAYLISVKQNNNSYERCLQNTYE